MDDVKKNDKHRTNHVARDREVEDSGLSVKNKSKPVSVKKFRTFRFWGPKSAKSSPFPKVLGIETRPATHPMQELNAPPRPERFRKRRLWEALQRTGYFFFRQTSPIHRQDAKEKYWILWRDVEAAMHTKAMDLQFYAYQGLKDKSPEEVEAISKEFHAFSIDRHLNSPAAQTFSNLLLCARILSMQPLNHLENAEALNMMWRDITFVRTRLLMDADIIPDERLPLHLEFCRLECSKICPEKDNGLEEMCLDTALELVGSEDQTPADSEINRRRNQKSRRTLVAIFAKLNHMRLNDINAQLRIKKIYNVAFALLLVFSTLLLHLNERLTDQFVPYWVVYDQFWVTVEPWAPLTWVEACVDLAIFMLQNNLLIFIFFSGLLGGLFSTVMKLRSKAVNIGDVYLRSYLLTRPIVGALAATILYIIIKSNIVVVDLGIIQQVSKNSYMFGPVGFSFGFIMGFSERIILPTVDTAGSK